jgi:hypothetical protein
MLHSSIAFEDLKLKQLSRRMQKYATLEVSGDRRRRSALQQEFSPSGHRLHSPESPTARQAFSPNANFVMYRKVAWFLVIRSSI